MLLDVLIALAPNATLPHLSKSAKSPFEPSPAESGRSNSSATVTSADFTQIKIRLRAKEEKRKLDDSHRPQKRRKIADSKETGRGPFQESDMLGKDHLSIRFQFSD
jgi:hypothetical protein